MKWWWRSVKDSFGCQGRRFKMHRYEWDLRGVSWWMWCATCGKGVGLDLDKSPIYPDAEEY